MTSIFNIAARRMRAWRIRRLEAKLARLVAESERFPAAIGAPDESMQVERYLQLDAEIRATRAQLEKLRD